MFEQENLQGWNISHIVSSWHRGLGKENAAVAPSLAFKHRVENLTWKKTAMKTGRGLGGEEDPWGVSAFPVKGNGI